MKRNRYQEFRNHLVEMFPEVFSPKGVSKPPLKIGIHVDILARNDKLSRFKLRYTLACYTSGYRYLVNMVEGAERIDLDGNVCGQVTAAEAAYATDRIKALNAAFEAHRKAANKLRLPKDRKAANNKKPEAKQSTSG